MSDKMRESLSALMDDEANELELQRVLKQIEDDGELRQTWLRYHATRSVMTGQGVGDLKLDISARVRTAINESEAAPSLRQRIGRPFASFAVAASVAATVVLGGQQLAKISSADDPYGSQSVATVGSSPVGLVNTMGATAVQASYGNQAVPSLQPAGKTAYKELARQRMEMYMQEHAEQAALNSPQGLMPFARVEKIRK
ncbi:sigma-E factor negative regulatory protein [Halioglobus sp. HI00S01]|uniref:sigma-E factor negative regulatory protein n=1 Tax=Halioglobus sp. HI00S01 TaxID=1822214 RepID=UPI0018D32099|nr:sigma-E factor negative regulatory protein [Halioglobus sp. HI00S01]